MNPRKPTLLTPEDDAVWCRIFDRTPWDLGLALRLSAAESNRRDAELMLQVERARAAEIAETVDGNPLRAEAYVHSLMLASEIMPDLAPGPFRLLP